MSEDRNECRRKTQNLVNSRIPKEKGEGNEQYLYSAILADTPLTKRSDINHTVLPANYTMSAFHSKKMYKCEDL